MTTIIKICSKHGELTAENVHKKGYTNKEKTKIHYGCNFCKRENAIADIDTVIFQGIANKQSDWISVKDRLPKNDFNRVLVLVKVVSGIYAV